MSNWYPRTEKNWENYEKNFLNSMKAINPRLKNFSKSLALWWKPHQRSS